MPFLGSARLKLTESKHMRLAFGTLDVISKPNYVTQKSIKTTMDQNNALFGQR
jgi:hypothetical protein